MRKLSVLLALALSLSVFSCTNMNGNQENKVNGLASESTVAPGGENNGVAPEYLTYDSFREKVWDFEKNPQEWHYEGDIPCVIDFYADWCKPCKMVAPIMDELAVKYEGKVKIYKINVDKEKKLAGVFGINSIPAVLFSPKEGQPSMQAGALPKAQYIEIIEKSLLKNDPSK
jgi:thioredoxin